MTVLLLIAVALVGTRTYWLWKSTPWDLPAAQTGKAAPVVEEVKPPPAKPLPSGTETIVSKNLFDPERGEGKTREVESSSRSAQRIRSMVLLGTAIVGNNRFAIVRDQTPAPVPGQRPGDPSQNVMRLKVGDNVEGFRLSEIGDKQIVFTQGAAKIEVALDYFRKDPIAPQRPSAPQPGAPGSPVIPRRPVQGQDTASQPQVTPVTPPGQVPGVPRVIPNLPRRERLPLPRPNPVTPEKDNGQG